MSKINKEIYDMVYEDDFEYFNKIFNVMCHYGDKCYKDDCTYAHNSNELKVRICLYYFSDGCNYTSKTCKFSHNRNDAIKAMKMYRIWMGDEETSPEVKTTEKVKCAEDVDMNQPETKESEEIYTSSLDEDMIDVDIDELSKPKYVINDIDIVSDMEENEDIIVKNVLDEPSADIAKNSLDISKSSDKTFSKEIRDISNSISKLTYVVYQQTILIQNLYKNITSASGGLNNIISASGGNNIYKV